MAELFDFPGSPHDDRTAVVRSFVPATPDGKADQLKGSPAPNASESLLQQEASVPRPIFGARLIASEKNVSRQRRPRVGNRRPTTPRVVTEPATHSDASLSIAPIATSRRLCHALVAGERMEISESN